MIATEASTPSATAPNRPKTVDSAAPASEDADSRAAPSAFRTTVLPTAATSHVPALSARQGSNSRGTTVVVSRHAARRSGDRPSATWLATWATSAPHWTVTSIEASQAPAAASRAPDASPAGLKETTAVISVVAYSQTRASPVPQATRAERAPRASSCREQRR